MKNNPERKQLVQTILTELCENIGGRPVGSENNRKAQMFVGNMFEDFGIPAEMQSFECIDWKKGDVALKLGDKEIPAEISPYSLPVSVDADFGIFENVEQLKNSFLKDKVAILSGDITKEAIMPKNFRFWNPEHHQGIIKILEEKSPKAIVTISFSQESAVPIFEDGDFDIPSVVVAGKYFELFKKAASKKIHLSFNAERIPSTGTNVIARLNPEADRKVIVCAHLDTKPGTPGALDNASGIATILLTGKILKNIKLDIGIELVAFNGEDYFSTPGQIAYIDTYSVQFDKSILAVNCDGVGFKEGKTGISSMNCPAKIENIIANKIKKYNALVISEPWYQGDHMIFAGAGLPTLAVTSLKIFELVDSVIHTEKDKVSLINVDYVCDTAEFIADIIKEL